MTWNIISPLVDPVVADKIIFVYDTQRVLELVNAEHLPVEYGGLREAPYPVEGLDELVAQGLYP